GGNTIGGSAAGAGNVIGSFASVGLQFGVSQGGSGTVQGNRIGVDATGTVALMNVGTYGIVVNGTNGPVTIGGSAAGAGNVIRGGSNGIWVTENASMGPHVIQGNHIGVSLDGTVPFPSGTSGIFISGGTGIIGGEGAGEGNVIAYSGANAITVA